MIRALPVLLLVSLPACAPLPDATPTASSQGGLSLCQGIAASICRFLNAPVRLENRRVELPDRAYPFYPTENELEFVDAASRRWIAPKGTLTDGASIPPMFISMLGRPNSPEFVNAAAMHDALCGVGNEALRGYHSKPWEMTHRMFYEALRVGGTDRIRAKIMYAAVYLGGPRWDVDPAAPATGGEDARQGIVSSQGRVTGTGTAPSRGLSARAAGRVPDVLLRAELRRTIAWIRRTDPSIPAIEMHLWSRERQMIADIAAQAVGGDFGEGMYGDGALPPGNPPPDDPPPDDPPPDDPPPGDDDDDDDGIFIPFEPPQDT